MYVGGRTRGGVLGAHALKHIGHPTPNYTKARPTRVSCSGVAKIWKRLGHSMGRDILCELLSEVYPEESGITLTSTLLRLCTCMLYYPGPALVCMDHGVATPLH